MLKLIGQCLPAWLVLTKRYWDRHGTIPNLLHPRTFNERILRRIAFNRDPLFALFADKWRVREYVEARLGPNVLPHVYHVTNNPDLIPFDDLPERFVVKPTHGSGWIRIVDSKVLLDRPDLIAQCKSWLAQNLYDTTREWVYRDIPPRILIEELIDDGHGTNPVDYKFMVYDGTVQAILAVIRCRTGSCYHYLTPDWEPLKVTLPGSGSKGTLPRPARLLEMIRAAEVLGAGIAFVRVDLYSTDEKIYFGELTTSPGCGMQTFSPASFDVYLGAFWPETRLSSHPYRLGWVKRHAGTTMSPFHSVHRRRPRAAGGLLLQPAAVQLCEVDRV